jgi:hypothetical protein
MPMQPYQLRHQGNFLESGKNTLCSAVQSSAAMGFCTRAAWAPTHVKATVRCFISYPVNVNRVRLGCQHSYVHSYMNHQESFSTRLTCHVRQQNLYGHRATGENLETLRTAPVHDSHIKRDRVAHNFQVSQFTSPALDQHHLPSLLRLASAEFSPL